MNNKDAILADITDAIDSLKRARDKIIESKDVDNKIIDAWNGVKNFLGITNETPNKEEVVEKVEKKVDDAVDATADKVVDEVVKVVETKAEETKATADDGAKAAISKVKEEAVKEIKEKIETKKAEVKIEEKAKKV